jgi:membrane protein
MNLYRLFRKSFYEFAHHDPLRLAAATAFFSTFAIPALLILITSLLSLLFHYNIIRVLVVQDISRMIGSQGADELNSILQKIHAAKHPLSTDIAGVLFLFFVFSTLLMIIQKTINQLWGVRQRVQPNVGLILKKRFFFLAGILLITLLFTLSVSGDAVLLYLGVGINKTDPTLHSVFDFIVLKVISLFIITIFFAYIFRYVPDGRFPWPVIWRGAVVTAILFSIGKWIIGRLLVHSDIADIYGQASSILFILLFVFYTSLILYFGATLTKCYADQTAVQLIPTNRAYRFVIQEIEENKG